MANVVEHLTQLSRGREITPDDLPSKLTQVGRPAMHSPTATGPLANWLMAGTICPPSKSWSVGISRCC